MQTFAIHKNFSETKKFAKHGLRKRCRANVKAMPSNSYGIAKTLLLAAKTLRNLMPIATEHRQENALSSMKNRMRRDRANAHSPIVRRLKFA
jgi:hypothetical protein